MIRIIRIFVCISVFSSMDLFAASSNVIEEQLQEIGAIPNEEVMVVQRKYTRKNWRHELNPVTFGGMPFGTVRRTLVGGASYTLHFSDWLAWEGLNFTYTKNFFSSFTDDINSNKSVSTQQDIKPDYQKLLYFMTSGVQITPFYGKISTFSRWIAYVEPYISLGAGIAKTETNSYLTFYPGIGIRAFFREWFSMRVELRDYLYSEKYIDRGTSGGAVTTSLRNNYAVMVAFSFWLPKMPR
jgi:outer membrane beta-barrel protein